MMKGLKAEEDEEQENEEAEEPVQRPSGVPSPLNASGVFTLQLSFSVSGIFTLQLSHSASRPHELPQLPERDWGRIKEVRAVKRDPPDPQGESSQPSAPPPPAQRGSRGRMTHEQTGRAQGQEEEERLALTTRYGKVYHQNRNCDYLKAPRTGIARQSVWCEECKEKVGIQSGFNIWTAGWGAPAHVTQLRGDLLRYTPCTRCAGH